MPLLDHFHAPLHPRRQWNSFHNAWATYLAEDLNKRLPQDWFAEPTTQFGIEVDVATWDETVSGGDFSSDWPPEKPDESFLIDPAIERAEVLVYGGFRTGRLAAAIELVSPANKDRPSHRKDFVSKCRSYLQENAGVIIVDIVTNRKADLHSEVIADYGKKLNPRDDLYATAYRQVLSEKDAPVLEVWERRMDVGDTLPTLPLWLNAEIAISVDLESTYEETCQRQKIPSVTAIA